MRMVLAEQLRNTSSCQCSDFLMVDRNCRQTQLEIRTYKDPRGHELYLYFIDAYMYTNHTKILRANIISVDMTPEENAKADQGPRVRELLISYTMQDIQETTNNKDQLEKNHLTQSLTVWNPKDIIYYSKGKKPQRPPRGYQTVHRHWGWYPKKEPTPFPPVGVTSLGRGWGGAGGVERITH